LNSSSSATNSTHLEKCSIITKTCLLCLLVIGKDPAKSKLHQNPKPIIGNNYNWDIGALKEVCTLIEERHL
jgi:hypothetical protein